jgi:hypothetical protein
MHHASCAPAKRNQGLLGHPKSDCRMVSIEETQGGSTPLYVAVWEMSSYSLPSTEPNTHECRLVWGLGDHPVATPFDGCGVCQEDGHCLQEFPLGVWVIHHVWWVFLEFGVALYMVLPPPCMPPCIGAPYARVVAVVWQLSMDLVWFTGAHHRSLLSLFARSWVACCVLRPEPLLEHHIPTQPHIHTYTYTLTHCAIVFDCACPCGLVVAVLDAPTPNTQHPLFLISSMAACQPFKVPSRLAATLEFDAALVSTGARRHKVLLPLLRNLRRRDQPTTIA